MDDYMINIKNLLQEKLKSHQQSDICYRLGYISKDECNGYDKFIKDMQTLKRYINILIKHAEKLEKHECIFDKDDYCIHCGLDGLA